MGVLDFMVRTLLKSVRQYKTPAILSPLFITGEVILECILPFIMARLIDSLNGNSMKPIIYLGLLLILITILSLFCGIAAARYAATASCGYAKNLRQDLFYRVQNFAFSDIDSFSTSSLVTRLTTDVTNVQNAFQMIIRIAVRTPLMFLFSIIMSLSVNVKMSLIFLCIAPVIAIIMVMILRYVMPYFRKIFKKYDAMNNSVEENLLGIRVVKTFVREDYEMKKFDKTSSEVCKDFTHVEKILAFNSPMMQFFIYLAIFLVSFIGAKTIILSNQTLLTTGELSSLITYGIQILVSLMMLSFVFVGISIAQESARRICEVLEHESSLTSPENGIKKVKNGQIEFNNVSFSYKKTSKKPALSNINLKINSGTTLGIIGGTGSSKTTLIQLISRLYDATEGEVLVGGENVKNYDLTSLREQVSVVLQKNVLFSGTIKENLRWGNKNASDEELIRVSKLAQADEFVQQFKEKYDYLIEQGGTNVSGGQKQRLCIARALLKKPKILILDDSTSAVDTKTDALIRKAMKTEIPETTKIIIAQRISSVQDSDMIIVLDDGKICEQGTHDELLAKKGVYYEIFETQTNS